jgi:penicillin-binding protein 2
MAWRPVNRSFYSDEPMKYKPFLLVFCIFLVGCSIISPDPTKTPTPTTSPTATLGNVEYNVTPAPDSQSAAQEFLQAWQDEDYSKMYSMLTSLSQDAISETDFKSRYSEVAVNLTLKNIDFNVLSSLTNPTSSQVSYQVTFHTTLMGDITPDSMVMNLSLNNGAWQVAWDDGMIMPALKGGNVLRLDYEVPSRGNIYDRNGHAIVAQTDAVALGVVPGEIDANQEGTLLRELSLLTGFDQTYIQGLYEYAGANWYVAIGEASAEEVAAEEATLDTLSGLRMNPFRSRYYYDGGVASQTIGFVQPIGAEELETYERQGYYIGQKVGKDGLELWGESYLAGTNGATLYVTDSAGQIITRLAHTDPIPSQSIYTTLDKDLQNKLQKTLGDNIGAIVVMEKSTGKVLAMVSNPSFDPNLFEPDNYNSSELANLLSDTNYPMYNRADQGLYPLGSVFKIITMAAALESGLYTANTTYDCGLTFTELSGTTLYDWTYEHEVAASGLLTLPEGLMRSCNPYFWHIGLDLYNQGLTTAVSDMARAFGLGSVTGFELPEKAGNIPDAESQGDAVQLAIGQGTMLVTPLQVVAFVAAVGNGGTIYEPQIVDKVVSSLDSTPSLSFSPVITGTLPVSAENLAIIQNAMHSVVSNSKGTAFHYLGNLYYAVSGKTGTAQNSEGNPDAWFAGYTSENDPNYPDIAIAVLIENGGEGSQMAAPIFRRVVTLYFSDNTDWSIVMPWESSPYVVATPTPLVSDSPTDQNTPTS